MSGGVAASGVSGLGGRRGAVRTVAASLQRVHDTGLVHLVMSLVAVQGAVYVTQLAVARLVTPAEFAAIRTAEMLLAAALVAGSLGMPSLAVQSIASLPDAPGRGRLLGRLLAIAAATAAIAALAAVAVGGTLRFEGAALVRALGGVLVLSAVGRVCINYFQGIRDVRAISVAVAMTAIVTSAALLALVWRFGTAGWVAGRYVAEGSLAAVALWFVRRDLSFAAPLPPAYATRVLASMGAAIAASLLVRAAQDALALVLLSSSAVDPTDVGEFAFGTLLASALALGPGALAGVVLPRMVERLGDPAAARAFMRRAIGWGLLLTVPPAAAIIALAPIGLERLLPEYAGGTAVIQLLVTVGPLRAVTTVSGAQLLAAGWVRAGLLLNVASLVALAIAATSQLDGRGAAGVAAAVILVETLTAVAFTLAAHASASRPRPAGA